MDEEGAFRGAEGLLGRRETEGDGRDSEWGYVSMGARPKRRGFIQPCLC